MFLYVLILFMYYLFNQITAYLLTQPKTSTLTKDHQLKIAHIFSFLFLDFVFKIIY